jgi:hypothetical protein
MAHQEIDRLAIAQHQMGLLHVEVLEEMAYTIAAVERATHDVVEAEAGLSVFDHVPERSG